MCVASVSKANYSRKFKFGTLELYDIEMLLEFFHEDRTNDLYAEIHVRIQIHYVELTD